MTHPLPPTDLSAFLTAVQSDMFSFSDVISFISDHYRYTPVSFTNGMLNNPAGVNEGSCKVFGFAKLHNLNQLDTLSFFCEHYADVKANPKDTTHANIRNFMYWGWQAFSMPVLPLSYRT